MQKKATVLTAFILTLPVIFFFSCYWFNHPHELIPTGFIQYDNPGYIAYGKQYLDAGNFHLLYNNPFNDSANYSRIYFQTQSLLIAFILKTGFNPAYILTFFTIVCSFFCFVIIIKIYDFLFPVNKYRLISLLFFAWGGGVLFLSNIPVQLIYPSISHLLEGKPIILDPGNGWWGLNFGRSLFFSCEAYYHLLFISTIFCVLKRKWRSALILQLILSFSHPFTGIELLTIVAAWAFIEKVIFKDDQIPVYFLMGSIALLVTHVFYYLYFLNLFPDHQSVSQQYSLNWRLRFYNIIPAYLIVGTLVVITLRKLKWKENFSNTNIRLFLTWFVLAFILANHELLIKPMQPIHFTRGYIWTSLFIIGIPGLHYLLSWLNRQKGGLIYISIFAVLFLLDNTIWIYENSGRAKKKSVRFIGSEEKEILSILSHNTDTSSLIIGQSNETDAILPYLATVYTKSWSWTSHSFTTPFIAKKREAYRNFILNGSIDSSWINRSCFFIFRKSDSLEMIRSNELKFKTTVLADTKSYKLISGLVPGN